MTTGGADENGDGRGEARVVVERNPSRGVLAIAVLVSFGLLVTIIAVRARSNGDPGPAESGAPAGTSAPPGTANVQGGGSRGEEASSQAELRATIEMVEATNPESMSAIERYLAEATPGTRRQDEIDRLLQFCEPSACSRITQGTGISPGDSSHYGGVVDPPRLWAAPLFYERLLASNSRVGIDMSPAGGAVSGSVEVTFTSPDAKQPTCPEEPKDHLQLQLSGNYTPPSAHGIGIAVGTVSGSWGEDGIADDGATVGYWVATLQPGSTRLQGTLFPPTVNTDTRPWAFAADTRSTPEAILGDLRVQDAQAAFPTPSITATIDMPPGPVLVYATNAGVFVSDAHGRATQLDVTGPADVVSSFSVSRDRRLFSWSVQPEFGLDRWKGSRLVVADLVAHRVDTYSWHGRPEEAEDDDVPPTVGAAPTSLVAVFHGQLVRFEDNGQVQSSTLDIPVAGAPGAPEYSPCGFSRYEALGQFNDHVLITAHYPTGGNEPGSQVLTFAPDGSDGRYEFDASGGPSDVTQPLGDGSLLFIDGGHQWRSVQRITTGESRGSSIDITPPAGPPLAGWGVMANSLTYNEGQIYVSYNVSAANYDQARTYVATIDATGAHNVDLAASWVEAGPRRSLAYIADDGRLIVRDSVGSETTIAASVTTATWTGG